MRHIIRLSMLEIENIKNVQYGKIEFARGRKGSILGIYGQNGSGKTVVVDCMVMLKCLLSGRRMPARFYHYINALAETARVQYGFEIWTDAKTMYAVYEVEITKNGENSFCISAERLSVREIEEGKRTRLTPIFEYQKGDKELFRPLKYYARFQKDMESMVALGIARQTTEEFDEEKQIPKVGSFLFSRKAQEVFEKADGDTERIYAKFVTGAYYYFGLGNIEKDYNKAFQIIKECAYKGHIAAIYDLGANYYFNGNGTDINYDLADYYLNLAKENGLKRAIDLYDVRSKTK